MDHADVDGAQDPLCALRWRAVPAILNLSAWEETAGSLPSVSAADRSEFFDSCCLGASF